VYALGQQSPTSYLDSKYLMELEYFSENAKTVWNSSKTGDMYYIYNTNTGNIDNVYQVVGIPGEVEIGDEEDILESNRYFLLLDTFAQNNPVGKTFCFFDENMNLESS
jgi:hypothetical protein